MGSPSAAGLITLMPGRSMAAIDSSIVNLSLPVIRHQFKVDVLISAFVIALALIPALRLPEKHLIRVKENLEPKRQL